jgi:hypothetical protein
LAQLPSWPVRPFDPVAFGTTRRATSLPSRPTGHGSLSPSLLHPEPALTPTPPRCAAHAMCITPLSPTGAMEPRGLAPPPLDSGNRRLQVEASTLAIEGTRPPPPRLLPIKGHPASDEDPHPSNSPPPGPHCAGVVAISSRSSTTVALPPYHRTSSGEGRN